MALEIECACEERCQRQGGCGEQASGAAKRRTPVAAFRLRLTPNDGRRDDRDHDPGLKVDLAQTGAQAFGVYDKYSAPSAAGDCQIFRQVMVSAGVMHAA